MIYFIGLVVFVVLFNMTHDVYKPIVQNNIKNGKFMPFDIDNIKVFFMLMGTFAVSDVISSNHVSFIFDIILILSYMIGMHYFTKKSMES